MKIKDLFKRSDFKYFIIIIILLILALPFIFPEEEHTPFFYEGILAPKENAPLPIFHKKKDESALKKNLKDSYIPEQKPQPIQQDVIQKIKENIKTNNSKPALSRDFLFMDEEEETAPSFDNSAYYQNTENYNDYTNQTMLSKNNADIIPTKDGYYHQGKFYKEGTYPPNANKKAIDKIISNYNNSRIKLKKNKGERQNLTNLGTDSPTTKGLEKDTANHTLPSESGNMPNIAKAENFKDSKTSPENTNISGYNGRDNWPNGYYDNYNPYTLNMHDMYSHLNNGIKEMVANNIYNIEKPGKTNNYNSGNTPSASSNNSPYAKNSHSAKNANNDNTNQDKKAENNHNTKKLNSNNILVIGDNIYGYDIAKSYVEGVLHNIGCNSAAVFTSREVKAENIEHKITSIPNFSLVFGACNNLFNVKYIKVAIKISLQRQPLVIYKNE